MADTVAASYPQSTSPGNPDQQYVQHQYAYQASPGGHQYYSGASGVEQQQVVQETGEQQVTQEANYAQYTQSGAELPNEQQAGSRIELIAFQNRSA